MRKPLNIRKYPDPILKKKCAQIEEVTGQERALAEKMFFAMRHFDGIGLAAPQVGVSKRMIVADIGKNPIMLINPLILAKSGMDRMEEKCLSVSDAVVGIDRPERIVVSGLNEKGRRVEIKAEGLLARVFQHEIDHLDGTLIIDYLIQQKSYFL